MKKPTNFAKYISHFLTSYLPGERGLTDNTLKAYRDCFILLQTFMENIKNEKLEKITLEKIKKETVLEFLDWLEIERKCSVSTRNSRLAALHSFYRYLQSESLDYLFECQKILSIKFKRGSKVSMNYLSIEGITLLLKQPDTTELRGRRDLALLSLLYDTGARVQEIIDLTPSMLLIGENSSIRLLGKGRKMRQIPLSSQQVELLKKYMNENKKSDPQENASPLFSSSKNKKLTRAGINYILKKYIKLAKKEDDSLIPKNISCHSLRHSKAMHLLQAGIRLYQIRDILGHVSITTTETYARADSKQKRVALEKAYVNVNPEEKPEWENKDTLMWLKNLI